MRGAFMYKLPYSVSVFVPTVAPSRITEITIRNLLGDDTTGCEAIYMPAKCLQSIGVPTVVSVLSLRPGVILFLEDEQNFILMEDYVQLLNACHVICITKNLFVEGNSTDKFEVLWQGYNFDRLFVFISDGAALSNIFFTNSITEIVARASYFVGANTDLLASMLLPRLSEACHEDGSRLELAFREVVYCRDNNCVLAKYNVARRYTHK